MVNPNETTRDFWQRSWAALPESKLELIEGRLVIGTPAGSRRVAWTLLQDYGPGMALPLAPAELWWEAVRRAFDPRPLPRTVEEWSAWADTVEHDPEPAPAGPRSSAAHREVCQRLQLGLFHLAERGGRGQSLGRDFVVRLGEDGVTPDLMFLDRASLRRLHSSYFDGPPPLVIEVLLEGSEEQDRGVKQSLYEQAGIPEYWLVDPAAQQVTFLRLGEDGRYIPVPAATDEQALYRSTAVPGLALSQAHLWAMGDTDWSRPSLPFLPLPPNEDSRAPEGPEDPDDLGWDSLPFAPRIALEPVPIRFAEYLSWAPEAKFEALGGGLLIGGPEGSRRTLGLLLMTLGLVEMVKLATPREWVTFLHQEPHRATVQERAAAILAEAQYKSSDESAGDTFVQGEIPHIPALWVVEDTLAEAQSALSEAVWSWVLLRIARRQD